jgi:hypothetical protein
MSLLWEFNLFDFNNTKTIEMMIYLSSFGRVIPIALHGKKSSFESKLS